MAVHPHFLLFFEPGLEFIVLLLAACLAILRLLDGSFELRDACILLRRLRLHGRLQLADLIVFLVQSDPALPLRILELLQLVREISDGGDGNVNLVGAGAADFRARVLRGARAGRSVPFDHALRAGWRVASRSGAVLPSWTARPVGVEAFRDEKLYSSTKRY